MATTLDLDEYLGDLMEVKKHGKVIYLLRRDVNARILVAAFSIKSVAQRLAGFPEDVEPDEAVRLAEAAVDTYYEDNHKVCLRIVQHSYPQETSAALNEKLDESDQEIIVRAFFSRRSPESNPPQPATGEISNGTGPITTANRATRRAVAAKAKSGTLG